MRRPLIATTLVVAGTFGTGYLVGQIKGAAPSFAATTAAAKKHTANTTKKLVTGRATQKQAATPSTGKHADGQVTAVSGNTITVKADADKAGSNEYTAVTTILLRIPFKTSWVARYADVLCANHWSATTCGR